MQLTNILLFTSLIILYSFLIITYDLSYIIPNLLLFTGFRETTKYYWNKTIKIDQKIIYDHTHIPIIQKEDYSFELLKKATNNFRNPVVVKDLFNDTFGVKEWYKSNYLPSIIGNIELSVIPNGTYGTVQSNRYNSNFSEAFNDILNNENSTKYLFFPVTARKDNDDNKNNHIKKMKKIAENELNKLINKDLDIQKILWNSFSTKKHKTYLNSQLIVGRGQKNMNSTTGTGWHCAMGNNWFVQVVGKKRWYFLNPKYSSLFNPLRAGPVAMHVGINNFDKYHENLPLEYVDLESGDLLYNPDWYWHTIQNYEGLSIGVPIREFNISLSFQNNYHFASIVIINKIFEKIGIDIGGYLYI